MCPGTAWHELQHVAATAAAAGDGSRGSTEAAVLHYCRPFSVSSVRWCCYGRAENAWRRAGVKGSNGEAKHAAAHHYICFRLWQSDRNCSRAFPAPFSCAWRRKKVLQHIEQMNRGGPTHWCAPAHSACTIAFSWADPWLGAQSLGNHLWPGRPCGRAAPLRCFGCQLW